MTGCVIEWVIANGVGDYPFQSGCLGAVNDGKGKDKGTQGRGFCIPPRSIKLNQPQSNMAERGNGLTGWFQCVDKNGFKANSVG